MRSRRVRAFALVVAASLPCAASGSDRADPDDAARLPALGAGVSITALIAAGAAATLALSRRSDKTESVASEAPRTRSYSSAADFRTSEYAAQHGLRIVGADALYFNGHERWYAGAASDPAAGTGVGVKVAVGDTGINAREAATGGVIAIDAAASYDYVNNRSGSAADDYGHGTHVAGIIAAPKNAAGMHGLAYNATVVNFKIGNSAGLITASDAQRADMLYRAARAGAMIINNSWASGSAITAFSLEQLQPSMRSMIDASRWYVANGGVVVFAAGNAGASQPAVEAGLPHLVSGIRAGWLAVVAVDGSGVLAGYSNRCGVAAAWCLAAPGSGVYSMYNDGGYAGMSGTSMAAPHAAAAIAALKSMFPNLSYLQIRERLLHTANRSGAYADAASYGQGLMDVGAASSPVGGVALPTGASASGATASVAGSGIEFQAGALRALGMQDRVLVLDNFQRAPFWVPARTFFREAVPRLVERQWASLRSRGPGRNAVAADIAGYRFGFSNGAGGEALLGSQLELAWVPHLAAPAVDSVAMGYAVRLGGMRIGLLGSVPALQETSERTLESSSLGSRKAFGMIAQRRAAATTYGVSLAMADDFDRPLGMATRGAFGVDASTAFSSGAFVEQELGRATTLSASLEISHHRQRSSGPLSAPGFAVSSASFGARTRLGAGTALSASLKHEWSGGEAARLQLPLTIDESGAIGSVTYALPYDLLLGRTAFTLRLDHRLAKQVDLRVALTHERYGFGASVTGMAALLEITAD
ncbi:MAG TPA: S8 family peptidase [Burkholderiales bacterium]|nr:S8 family peptidase [Burkholderiales bacterium]